MRPRRRTFSAFRSIVLVIAACGGIALPAHSAREWIKLETPNFELYTTSGEKAGRAAILHFEQIHAFFTGSTGRKSEASGPVRVIAFSSAGEFKPYRPNEVAGAFYTHGNGHDYIVMQDLTSNSYTAAVHEYFHLWVKDSKLPLWLNEGLAEFYSTLEPRGEMVKVGGPPVGRYQMLLQNRWIPVETLLDVGHDSKYYNERDRAGMFYAESWGLAHMLNMSDQYRGRFNDFYNASASGVDSRTAFQQIYGKTPEQVEKELRLYLPRARAGRVNLKMEKANETPDVRPASAVESGLALADLLAAMSQRQADAKKAYEQLLEDNPGSWEVHAALARIAWHSNQRESARAHFAKAVELGATDPELYYDYAGFLHEENEPASALIPILSKAVELRPTFSEAQYNLGYYYYHERDYRNAVEHLKKVTQIKDTQALAYFQLLAYADHELGERDAAIKAAQQARQYATATNDILAVDKLLDYVSSKPLPKTAPRDSVVEAAVPSSSSEMPTSIVRQPDSGSGERPQLAHRPAAPMTLQEEPGKVFGPPTHYAEGKLRQFDCLGKSARITIVGDGKEQAFLLVDPSTVLLRGTESATMDFSCGHQQPISVVIGYEAQPNAKLGTVGNVKSIEFK